MGLYKNTMKIRNEEMWLSDDLFCREMYQSLLFEILSYHCKIRIAGQINSEYIKQRLDLLPLHCHIKTTNGLFLLKVL